MARSLDHRIEKLEKALLPQYGDLASEIAALSDAELVELICASLPQSTLEDRRWVIEQNPKFWSDKERELFLSGQFEELRTLMLGHPCVGS